MTDDKQADVGPRIIEGVVKGWNRRYPVGTPVLYWPGALEGPGVESKTRSEAWILPSGAAVAMVEDYAGGIAIEHIMFRDDFPEAELS